MKPSKDLAEAERKLREITSDYEKLLAHNSKLESGLTTFAHKIHALESKLAATEKVADHNADLAESIAGLLARTLQARGDERKASRKKVWTNAQNDLSLAK